MSPYSRLIFGLPFGFGMSNEFGCIAEAKPSHADQQSSIMTRDGLKRRRPRVQNLDRLGRMSFLSRHPPLQCVPVRCHRVIRKIRAANVRIVVRTSYDLCRRTGFVFQRRYAGPFLIMVTRPTTPTSMRLMRPRRSQPFPR